jgi:hypothetical protein
MVVAKKGNGCGFEPCTVRIRTRIITAVIICLQVRGLDVSVSQRKSEFDFRMVNVVFAMITERETVWHALSGGFSLNIMPSILYTVTHASGNVIHSDTPRPNSDTASKRTSTKSLQPPADSQSIVPEEKLIASVVLITSQKKQSIVPERHVSYAPFFGIRAEAKSSLSIYLACIRGA